jgi:hypothetical protein
VHRAVPFLAPMLFACAASASPCPTPRRHLSSRGNAISRKGVAGETPRLETRLDA